MQHPTRAPLDPPYDLFTETKCYNRIRDSLTSVRHFQKNTHMTLPRNNTLTVLAIAALSAIFPTVSVVSQQPAATQTQQLDHTPDVQYRRAWTMAEHGGELFCSTLPSGKIYAYSQGTQVTLGAHVPKWLASCSRQSNAGEVDTHHGWSADWAIND